MKNHNKKLLSKFGNKKLKTIEAISKNLISRKKKTSFPPFLWGRRGPIKMITLQGVEESQSQSNLISRKKSFPNSTVHQEIHRKVEMSKSRNPNKQDELAVTEKIC